MNSLAKQRRRFILAALIVPTLLLVGFVMVPALDLVRMSFTNWDGLSKPAILYGSTITFPCCTTDLWQSLKNNAVYFCVHLCMIPVELAFAVLLNSRLRAANFTRPWCSCPISSTAWPSPTLFLLFFARQRRVRQHSEALRLGMLSRSWLSDPKIVNFCAGLRVAVAVFRLPCDPVHGGAAVPSPGCGGGRHHRRRKCLADVPPHPDPFHHAYGGLCPVR